MLGFENGAGKWSMERIKRKGGDPDPQKKKRSRAVREDADEAAGLGDGSLGALNALSMGLKPMTRVQVKEFKKLRKQTRGAPSSSGLPTPDRVWNSNFQPNPAAALALPPADSGVVQIDVSNVLLAAAAASLAASTQ